VSRATYQVPVEVAHVRAARRSAFAGSFRPRRERNEKTMTERFRPSCWMRRTQGERRQEAAEDTHKMAQANREFLALSLVTTANA